MKAAKIRYKYRPAKNGVELTNIKCPTCGNGINWTKSVNSYDWNGKIVLLAECWDGNIETHDRKDHLFLIRLDGLPLVDVSRVGVGK